VAGNDVFHEYIETEIFQLARSQSSLEHPGFESTISLGLRLSAPVKVGAFSSEQQEPIRCFSRMAVESVMGDSSRFNRTVLRHSCCVTMTFGTPNMTNELFHRCRFSVTLGLMIPEIFDDRSRATSPFCR
jgi:hypothetical protein